MMTCLNLSSNSISGSIPVELSKNSGLDILDISSNNVSGSIPSSLGDLTHLLILNLSNNHINGYIPAEFGNLLSIMEIDLSTNELSGGIPQQLRLLLTLMTLKLQKNKLSGSISSLTDIPNLVILNVSYNNLAGDIPIAKNFTRFPLESFLGNPGLCGYKLGSGCSPPQGKRFPKYKAVIIAFGVLLSLMVVGGILLAKRISHGRALSARNRVSNASSQPVIFDMNLMNLVYEDIISATEDFSNRYIIGSGASSTVYKCLLENRRPVAIKRLDPHSPHCLNEFETETKIVGCIKHRNLVTLQGYLLLADGHLLFFDYMENGSLWDVLHDPSKKRQLNWAERFEIALGASQVLVYLHHDCNRIVIHRDVKSSNILLDKDFVPHLTDFGIAKTVSEPKDNTASDVRGTIGYIDPQYAQALRLSYKSDVYSVGVVLLELLTGRKAVDDGCNLCELIHSEVTTNTRMDIMDPDISISCCDSESVEIFFQLALQCTMKSSEDKPTMYEVVRALELWRSPSCHHHT